MPRCHAEEVSPACRPLAAASRTKSGVTRSPSPNHSGTTSGSPNTVIATSVMGVSERPPMGPLSEAPRPESCKRELSDMSSDLPHRRLFRQPAACPTIVGGETKPDLSLSNRQNMIRSRPMKRPALVLSPALVLLIFTTLLAGCATVPARNIDRVQAGMHRDQGPSHT